MRVIWIFSTVIALTADVAARGWEWQNPLPQGNPLYSVRFVDANSGWAVGEVGTIVHTTDGGETWRIHASGTTKSLFSVYFTDPSTGWVVGESGTILHTTNGGSTWTVQTSGVVLECVYFINASTGWAVGGNGSILHTTDGGSTWSAQTSGTMNALFSILFTDASTGWVVGAGGTILHTSDGGSTWTPQTIGTTKPIHSVCFSDASAGWAVGESGTILHTTDGGSTWIVQATGQTNEDLCAVHFSDPNTGWLVGGSINRFPGMPTCIGGLILHTTDGGLTWSAQTSGITNPLFSIQFTDPGTGWVVGASGTILHTSDGGSTWNDQTNGMTHYLYSIRCTDGSRGWAVGGRGTILHTTDGGSTWSVQTSGTTSEDLHSVYFTDPDTGWVVGGSASCSDSKAIMPSSISPISTDTFKSTSNSVRVHTGASGEIPQTSGAGTILHTTDGGITWTAQISGTTNPLFSVYCMDSRTCWAVGEVGTILHTTDGGSTWSAQTSGTTSYLAAVYFTDASTGWAVGGYGAILHTTDGGSTWSSQTSGTTHSIHHVCFTDPSTGWAVGGSPGASGGGVILHTTDGGSSWSAQTNATLLESVYFADPSTGWAVGWPGTILRTTDGGSTWSVQTSGTTNSIQSVYFTDASAGWAVGFGGTILHTTTGGTGNTPPAPPTPASPSNGSVVSTSSLLSWNPSSGALWYALQVSTSPYFTSYVLNQTGITAKSYQLANLEVGTTYYWRVSLRDDTGTSGWSEVWSFTTSSGMSCGDIASFNARCKLPNSRIQAFIVITDASHNGEMVEFTVDSAVYSATIKSVSGGALNVAAILANDPGVGDHTVTLTDPASCFPEKTVTCNGLSKVDEQWEESIWAEITDAQVVPQATRLLGNYPNPFNPSTTISYSLSNDTWVTLKIYNTLGQEVVTLVNDLRQADLQSVVWDGRNSDGQSVGSGMYIYKIQAGNVIKSEKILLMK